MARRNWSVPVNSLLRRIQAVGFTLTAVNNGEETIKINQQQSNLAIRKAAVEEVVSVDVATVYINKDNKSARLYLVLGNEPEELLCDYTVHPLIEAANDDYILQWEGKKCPTIED